MPAALSAPPSVIASEARQSRVSLSGLFYPADRNQRSIGARFHIIIPV